MAGRKSRVSHSLNLPPVFLTPSVQLKVVLCIIIHLLKSAYRETTLRVFLFTSFYYTVTGKVCIYSCLQGNLELCGLTQNCQFIRKHSGFVLPFGFSGSVSFPCIFHETSCLPAEETSTVVWVADVTLDLCSPQEAVHWPLGSPATCPLDRRRESSVH